VAETNASPESTSAYPNSLAANVCATSSFVVTVKEVDVGASLTELTVIDIESVSDAPSSSVVTTVIVASASSLEALVQVNVAIALLMLVTVPPNVIVASAVPSPAAKVRLVVWAREKVPLEAVITTDVIDVSSTSAIEFPVIARAVSSLTADGVPRVLAGASLTAANEVVITAESVPPVPS